MKITTIVCVSLIMAMSAQAQQAGPSALTNSATTSFDVDSISLGDSFEQHKAVLEESPADSKLAGCDKTYNFSRLGRQVAGVYFDVVEFGIKDGRVYKIYAWKRTYESKVSDYRKTATENLGAKYGDYDGKAKDKPSYGSPSVVRTWSKSGFSITLRTNIDGNYKPYTDRYATIEITATGK